MITKPENDNKFFFSERSLSLSRLDVMIFFFSVVQSDPPTSVVSLCVQRSSTVAQLIWMACRQYARNFINYSLLLRSLRTRSLPTRVALLSLRKFTVSLSSELSWDSWNSVENSRNSFRLQKNTSEKKA